MPPLQSILQGTEEKNLPRRHRGTEKKQKNLTTDQHGSVRISTGWAEVIFSSAVNPRQQRGLAKAPAILLLLAVAIFAAGAVRYYRHGNFSLAQAGYCVVAVLASLVVLLVFDYTLHHAKIAAVMVLIFAVLFLVVSPAFCVGMGLGLAGMVLSQSRR